MTPSWASPPMTRTGQRRGSRHLPCAHRWWPRWTTGRSVPPTPVRRDWVLRVARGADPDAWRDRVRDPAAWGDGAALAELARTAPVAEQPPTLLLALGERLHLAGGDGIGFLRRVQEQYPDDFWANFTLARALYGAMQAGQGRLDSGSRLLPEGTGHSAESGRRPERPRPRPGRRGLAGRQRRRPLGTRGNLLSSGGPYASTPSSRRLATTSACA